MTARDLYEFIQEFNKIQTTINERGKRRKVEADSLIREQRVLSLKAELASLKGSRLARG